MEPCGRPYARHGRGQSVPASDRHRWHFGFASQGAGEVSRSALDAPARRREQRELRRACAPLTITGAYDAYGNAHPIVDAARIAGGHRIGPIAAPGLALVHVLDSG